MNTVVKGQHGYALLTVVFMAALIAIALAVAAPSARTRGQRQLEEELIFRGNQYKRAIGLFYMKFNRYPMKIEDLLHTNDRSFLRKRFPDPMTASGEWRLIRVGPGGQLVGSIKSPSPAGSSSGSASREPQGVMTTGSNQASTQPIVGVASTSRERAFRVFDDQDIYYNWEFIFDPQEAVKDQLKAAQEGTQQQNPKGGRGDQRQNRRN